MRAHFPFIYAANERSNHKYSVARFPFSFPSFRIHPSILPSVCPSSIEFHFFLLLLFYPMHSSSRVNHSCIYFRIRLMHNSHARTRMVAKARIPRTRTCTYPTYGFEIKINLFFQMKKFLKVMVKKEPFDSQMQNLCVLRNHF